MEETKQAAEAPAEEVKVEEKKDVAPSIADIIGEKKEDKPEPKTVPEATFLEEKKARKALEKEVKDLRSRIDAGATDEEVSDSVEALVSKYGADNRGFLTDLDKLIEKRAKTVAESMVKPFHEKDRAEKIQQVFTQHFDKAMGDMEEYKGIVNKDVIFALSLNPSNSSKTIPQLIEDTYGNAVSGKRSIETTTPRGGTAPTTFDPARANKDAAYLREVIADPDLKKQYDEFREKNRRV